MFALQTETGWETKIQPGSFLLEWNTSGQLWLSKNNHRDVFPLRPISQDIPGIYPSEEPYRSNERITADEDLFKVSWLTLPRDDNAAILSQRWPAKSFRMWSFSFLFSTLPPPPPPDPPPPPPSAVNWSSRDISAFEGYRPLNYLYS